ncbi:spore germination protein [Paenibacillus roseipurpureus]|uniref:Spore germination protein n=1 Tax=Paenibacillus roseopurpureus TaxID=2918901 RepID=A0AA96LRW0_9BACL|nr:spore germination protein [Paenibacillus sp. MBLB1832]WNR46092.1 spore germination protein [Paenibacillus sp. MBLB1832]
MDEDLPGKDLISDFNFRMKQIKSMIGDSADFVIRELTIQRPILPPVRLALFYFDGMIDKPTLQECVIPSILNCGHRIEVDHSEVLSLIQHSIVDVSEVLMVDHWEKGIEATLSGEVLLLWQGSQQGLCFSIPGWEDRGVTESKTQSVVRGPQEAFSETLRTNTTLVRKRIKDPNVKLISKKAGSMTKTDIGVMYIQGLAEENMLQTLLQLIEKYPLDRVLEGEYLEEWFLKDQTKTIFPTIYNTDKPDTIAGGLLDGKIAIFIDGTPFVLLVPALFVDFIQSAEDYYQPYLYSNAIRLLRYLALLICLLAPAIYITLTTFHQDMLPTHLLLSLAAQREGIPFPAFIEAVLMEVTFEILREAGIRMPRTIGQAVSIVGTIVIGQAAVEANIVSAAMVIIVSITAISSFVIPSYGMSIGLRMLRFAFMASAASFGVYGITIAMIVLILHLNSLESFGIPYLSPSAPFHLQKQKDAILRFPYWAFRNKN